MLVVLLLSLSKFLLSSVLLARVEYDRCSCYGKGGIAEGHHEHSSRYLYAVERDGICILEVLTNKLCLLWLGVTYTIKEEIQYVNTWRFHFFEESIKNDCRVSVYLIPRTNFMAAMWVRALNVRFSHWHRASAQT